MKRIIYTVRPGDNGGWSIYIRGQKTALFNYRTKQEAVAFITKRARRQWERDGQKTQVLICDRHGKYQSERTYGEDPRRHKG